LGHLSLAATAAAQAGRFCESFRDEHQSKSRTESEVVPVEEARDPIEQILAAGNLSEAHVASIGSQ